ncbi:MAG: hypothetical protein MK161_08275 [Pirellulales bacterium]|nr:hypothetical protein [Pirellulales bacterium]
MRETHYWLPKGAGVCQPGATAGRGVVGAACGIMPAVWGGRVVTKLACCTGGCSPWVGEGTYWLPGSRTRGAIRAAGWGVAGAMAVGVMGLALAAAVKPGLRQAAGDTRLPLGDVDVVGEPG